MVTIPIETERDKEERRKEKLVIAG